MLRALLTPQRSAAPVRSAAARRVAQNTWFELVPLKNLEAQLAALPQGARVTVTCSPVKGIDATLDLCERLIERGLRPTPHIAARLVIDPAHVARIAQRCDDLGLDEVFVIAGDEEQPAGAYDSAVTFLRDFAAANHGLARIGVAGYPDGHVFISQADLHSALHAKQALIAAAGLDGWVSTQMCFDPAVITTWLKASREAGLTLPVRIGIPGPIDRTKLLTMGMKVGVGQSLRYLTKNRAGLQRLMTGSSYDPGRLLDAIGRDLDRFNVTGLHLFTFNQLGVCSTWVQGI